MFLAETSTPFFTLRSIVHHLPAVGRLNLHIECRTESISQESWLLSALFGIFFGQSVRFLGDNIFVITHSPRSGLENFGRQLSLETAPRSARNFSASSVSSPRSRGKFLRRHDGLLSPRSQRRAPKRAAHLGDPAKNKGF